MHRQAHLGSLRASLEALVYFLSSGRSIAPALAPGYRFGGYSCFASGECPDAVTAYNPKPPLLDGRFSSRWRHPDYFRRMLTWRVFTLQSADLRGVVCRLRKKNARIIPAMNPPI